MCFLKWHLRSCCNFALSGLTVYLIPLYSKLPVIVVTFIYYIFPHSSDIFHRRDRILKTLLLLHCSCRWFDCMYICGACFALSDCLFLVERRCIKNLVYIHVVLLVYDQKCSFPWTRKRGMLNGICICHTWWSECLLHYGGSIICTLPEQDARLVCQVL